jgi:PAS domain S-box-containing protein
MRKPTTTVPTDLRQRAQEVIRSRPSKARGLSEKEGQRAMLELEIHQVELEMQNDELRRARQEVEASLDRYTQLFDFAPIGYATLAPDATVREMNHVGAGLLYERRARMIGKRFALFIAPADRPSFHELFANVQRTHRKETREFDLVAVGDERPKVRLSVASLAGTEGTVLVAFEDITAERRAAERLLRADAALREADRRKDEFLAVLSHELRTPLSTLLMYSQLLRQGVLDEEKVKVAAETIERAARVQARLIDDLLDVSRIIAGKLSMRAEQVNAVDIARAALASVEREAEKKQVQIEPDFVPSLPAMIGDSERLQQAITNLLTNAIKFTPPEGKIYIRVHSVRQTVRIEVEDTGSGIDAAFLPHLFERFSQAERTITRSKGGLGLGLSIARSIVEAHHGTIRARSAGRGKGSTFSISLPIGTSPHVGVLASSTLLNPEGLSKIQGTRLLVVEDDSSTRDTLTEVLTMAGAEVRGAEGGAAAMMLLDNDFRPHVLVCDVAMPGEDGCALLRRIRARGATNGGDIPALALTAFAGDDDRERTRDAGFKTHLVKPVDIDQLISAVAKLLPKAGADPGAPS